MNKNQKKSKIFAVLIIAAIIVGLAAGIVLSKKTNLLSGRIPYVNKTSFTLIGRVLSAETRGIVKGFTANCGLYHQPTHNLIVSSSPVNDAKNGVEDGNFEVTFLIDKGKPFYWECNVVPNNKVYNSTLVGGPTNGFYKYGISSSTSKNIDVLLYSNTISIDLTGFVKDNKSKSPLKNANVECFIGKLNYTQTGTTNDSGYFVVKFDVPNKVGNYMASDGTKCTVSKDSYNSKTNKFDVNVDINQEDGKDYPEYPTSNPPNKYDLDPVGTFVFTLKGSVFSAQDGKTSTKLPSNVTCSVITTTEQPKYEKKSDTKAFTDGNFSFDFVDVPKGVEFRFKCTAIVAGYNSKTTESQYVSPVSSSSFTYNNYNIKLDPVYVKVNLEGTVLDDITSSPVQYVDVKCGDLKGSTGNDGIFSFLNVNINNSSENKSVVCSFTDNRHEPLNNQSFVLSPFNFNQKDGIKYTQTFKLKPYVLGINIAGIVYEEKNDKGESSDLVVPNAEVKECILKYKTDPSKEIILPSVSTDKNGKFLFENVQVDKMQSYLILFGCKSVKTGYFDKIFKDLEIKISANQSPNIQYPTNAESYKVDLARDIKNLVLSGSVKSAQAGASSISSVVSCSVKSRDSFGMPYFDLERSISTSANYSLSYFIPKNIPFDVNCEVTPRDPNYPKDVKSTGFSSGISDNYSSTRDYTISPNKIKINMKGRVFENNSQKVLSGVSVDCGGKTSVTDVSGKFSIVGYDIDNKDAGNSLVSCRFSKDKYASRNQNFVINSISKNQKQNVEYWNDAFYLNPDVAKVTVKGIIKSALEGSTDIVVGAKSHCYISSFDADNQPQTSEFLALVQPADKPFEFSLNVFKNTGFSYWCTLTQQTGYYDNRETPIYPVLKGISKDSEFFIDIKLSPKLYNVILNGVVYEKIGANETTTPISNVSMSCNYYDYYKQNIFVKGLTDSNGIVKLILKEVSNYTGTLQVSCSWSKTGYIPNSAGIYNINLSTTKNQRDNMLIPQPPVDFYMSKK